MSGSEGMAAQFRERGYVVRPGLLDPAEVSHYRAHLERLSGRSSEWFARRRAGWLPGGLRDAWTLPDGVTRTPEFWPLLFHVPLLDAVRAVIGRDARYLQHTDLHVGFSALDWHRDNVNRTPGQGPDWDESDAPYRLVRVGLYLQGEREAGFALGLVPGTHRLVAAAPAGPPGLLWQACARLAGRDALARRADWVATRPGDAILFDPRIVHAGSVISGPKYSVFVAYGTPGPHFERHYLYYRHTRADLAYEDAPARLTARLAAAGLDPGPRPRPRPLESAWTPPPLLRRLARPRRSA